MALVIFNSYLQTLENSWRWGICGLGVSDGKENSGEVSGYITKNSHTILFLSLPDIASKQQSQEALGSLMPV